MKIECPECHQGTLTTEGVADFAYFRCPACGVEFAGVMRFPDDLEPVGRNGKTNYQLAVERGDDKRGTICPCGHYGTAGVAGNDGACAAVGTYGEDTGIGDSGLTL